jgi:DNA replication protein DnaC
MEEKKIREIRTANIMQYEEYLTKEKIESVVSQYRQIDKYAYVRHDKDTYVNQETESIDFKKPHFHIVLKFKNPVRIDYIAKWFGIEQQYINIPRGNNAFVECCQYLTHETQKAQEQNKHLYNDDEIFSNFDFRAEIDEYQQSKLNKYANSKTKKDKIRKDVLINGLKLSQIKYDDYAEDWQQLQKCRAEYIRNFAQLPTSRVNFYITGGSGTGKSLSSRALAKTLCDPFNKLKDEEVYFVVGQGASMFSGYDGQPVLIWDDLRAMDLLKQFNNNPGSVFNLFDVIPSASQQNVKYGSVKLINTINIVNSVQTFNEFVDVICFKNVKSEIVEPDKQLFRRFPFFIELSANQKFDFFVNKQFFNENEPNYKAYHQHKNLGIGLLKIEQAYKQEPEKKQELTNKHFKKVDEEHKKAIDKFENKTEDNVLELQQQLDLEIAESENRIVEVVDYVIEDKPEPPPPSHWNGYPNNWGDKKPPF